MTLSGTMFRLILRAFQFTNCANRSGAVEQLRVHVRNLSQLSASTPEIRQGSVELYEKGYGKDAAGIAKEAISYGSCAFPLRVPPDSYVIA